VFGDDGGAVTIPLPPPPRDDLRLWGVQRLGASNSLVVSGNCSSFFLVVT
jgi:hypothetical protein